MAHINPVKIVRCAEVLVYVRENEIVASYWHILLDLLTTLDTD